MRKMIFTAMICLTALCACTKEGTAHFEGYYTYKTSGTVDMVTTVTDASTGETRTENVTIRLKAESGQMNIITKDRDSGAMVVTMNAVGGDVITFNATAEGQVLTLAGTTKSFHGETTGFPGPYDFLLTGTGERLDDIVIIKFSAEGSINHLGREYTVTGSNIECVARLND